MKKLLSALLCVCLLCALLPTGAAAAVEGVYINGMLLNSTTPYYVNGASSITDDPQSGWNAYFDAANSTLHLKDLVVSTGEHKAIEVTNVTTLYIELEGTNTVTTANSDPISSGIDAGTTNLVIYGTGIGSSLKVDAKAGGKGISAGSIELQYPATLTVIGGTQAANQAVRYISSVYDATGGADVYNSADIPTAIGYKHIVFSLKSTPEFFVYVGDTRVTSANMGDVLGGAQAIYTPAHGSAQATLTLNGASITEYHAGSAYGAGIHAVSEPLTIHLIGTNTIGVQYSSEYTCGVYSEKALTITAAAGATLTASATIRGSSTSGMTYAIRSDESITLDNCEVTVGAMLSSDTKTIDDNDNYPLYSTATISALAPPPPPVYYPSVYTLTFVTNGGSELKSVTQEEYTTVDMAAYTPIRAGCIFAGWYSDAEFTKPVESVRLQKNTTVYARWSWINPFPDVAESDWFYGDVEWAWLNGLMSGTAADRFAPRGTVSRAMVWQVLFNLSGGESGDEQPWYADAQKWAAENGISDGTGAEGPATREQLVTMLYRYAKLKGYDVSVGEDTNILSYNDAFDITEEFIPAFQWACGAGLVQGDAGNLMPLDNAERCHMAAILHRFCEKYAIVR